ncbi:MAG TPA: VanZ family protein [Pyrinomonadaceae bacterium]|nr:VanZ family protein [Pyrinomonadaceae bacterium]
MNQSWPNSSTLSRRLVRYGPLLLWTGVILFASTGGFSAGNTSRIIRPLLLWLFPDITDATLTTVHFLTRKAAHFIEYAILAFLAARAFISSTRDPLRNHWVIFSFVSVAAVAAIDELHQSFVPARTGSFYDSLIDIAGGLTALLVCWLYQRRRGLRLGHHAS